MRPTPPLHRVDDEVGVVMTVYNHYFIFYTYVKVTWLNPAGGQFDIKWDFAMCSHHGNANSNSSNCHLQSMLTIMVVAVC